MDWVEEAPDRELPDLEEVDEFGFISLAFGASASSLHAKQDEQDYIKNEDVVHIFYSLPALKTIGFKTM